MPELPEVETVVRGLRPALEGRRLVKVEQRRLDLRFPLPENFADRLEGRTVQGLRRRAKYIVASLDNGQVWTTHLGMSGSIYIVEHGTPATVHEHFDFDLSSGKTLRYRDPRRFGSLHWSKDPAQHKLIKSLGPEPLGDAFSGEYLWRRSRGRRVNIKQFIMNANIVVGVGNIYASEALFLAGINPHRAAGRIALARYEELAEAVRRVLQKAIEAGGTTLRDFYGSDGEAGYFQQELAVYDRTDEPCRKCKRPISVVVLGQRSTFYCKNCQR